MPVRDKRIVKIQIVQILETDGVDSMEVPLLEDRFELTSIEAILSCVQTLLQKSREIHFSFL